MLKRKARQYGNGQRLDGAPTVYFDEKEDQEAFDLLGPMTRALLNDIPTEFSAADIVRQFRSRIPRQPDHWLKHPSVDGEIVRKIAMFAETLFSESFMNPKGARLGVDKFALEPPPEGQRSRISRQAATAALRASRRR